jgi:hypothetical protein
MKYISMLVCFLGLTIINAFTAIAQTAPSQAREDPSRLLHQFAEDIKQLKLELAVWTIEFQQAKVAELEMQRRNLRIERKKHETRKAEHATEAAMIDQHLGLPLEAEERTALEARKNLLSESGPGNARAEERQLEQRESELDARLQQEQERLDKMTEDLRKLRMKG